MESGRAEARDLLIGSSPKRPEEHRVVHRLEKVRLALRVRAEQREPPARDGAIEVGQIPEPAGHQTTEAHYSIVMRRETVGPMLPITSTPNTPNVIVRPPSPMVGRLSPKVRVSAPFASSGGKARLAPTTWM
jgi:hypothetical protein